MHDALLPHAKAVHFGRPFSMPPITSEKPIAAVHVISTGSAEQHKEHRYGSKLPRIWWALASRSWVEVPINVYVIEHRDGLVLFDAGLDPAIASDPNYVTQAIGRFFLRKVFRIHIGPDDALSKKLEGLGHAPADVRRVVVSHLHFDHIGCIKEVFQAELLVSREEWKRLSRPHPERDWILREHVELPGANWQPIDFVPTEDALIAPFGACYDVMGDGSMVLLPTPGHTPGSLSMLVRSDGFPPLLLVGDLTYEVDLLMRDQVPGVGDKTQLRSSFAKVRALKKQLPDLVILASHDPAAEGALRSASSLMQIEGAEGHAH
ncbi:MAG: N-acyl homoserine lactonase family protein [Proteobacteria bacterium]|nr:N-acyl homoserine lactonase family protein [Pseudomonadota bacterium]